MPTGWCPGTHTIPDMLAMYPDTSAVRIFFGPGDGLPASAWTDPRQKLSQVPSGADVIVSHKDQGVDAAAFVAAWEATGRTGRLILVPHHEPEQQEGGDPTRAQFRASWTRQREQVGAHPARAEGRLLLAVCYTLQWVRRGGDWRIWWPDHEADAVDLVLGDWYQYTPGEPNPYRPRTYEDPTAALKVLTDISAATGKPWGIAEIDHLRLTKANGFTVDLDVDGTLCADWYRRMHAEAKRLGCQVWAHFHRDHGDLGTRLPEQQTLRDLIGQEVPVTTAPETLKAARALLLEHLPIEAAALGIVGDSAHRGGYHCGADRVVTGDYSVVESSRDRAGLAEWACALDVGTFSVSVAGKAHDLRSFSVWLVAQCKANTADTRDIREVIYSPDGQTVKRWDRLGKRSSGDDSHRWHTHISYHRDAIKAGRDQAAVFTRYLTEIGLLEDDMPLTETDANTVWSAKAMEYVDERGDGARDVRTVKDILFATHAAAVAAANPAKLAQAVADELRTVLAEMPGGVTPEQLEQAAEQAFRVVLGSVDNATQS